MAGAQHDMREWTRQGMAGARHGGCELALIRFQTQPALFIARTAVHCMLKYQQWSMIRKLIDEGKCFQWRTVPI